MKNLKNIKEYKHKRTIENLEKSKLKIVLFVIN